MSFKNSFLFLLSAFVLSACGSSKIKERREQRDRITQSSKVYCEFINGEQFPDIDVALNLEMGKKCDLERPFSMTQYNTRSDSTGVLYCCSTIGKSAPISRKSEKVEKKEEKSAEGVED